MIQNVLQSLGGIQGYGVLSLLLFFAVFAGAVLYTFTRRTAELDAAAKLPLDEPELSNSPEDSQ